MNATQIIGQALGIIGVKSPGVALGNEAADCLLRLNMMLDGWRTERLYATAGIRVQATINANDQTATIGPTGDFVIDPRPIRIEGGFYTVGEIDYPIDAITEGEYNDIALKSIQTLGPSSVYYEAGDPTGTLYFYPLLGQQSVVTLICMGNLAEFADLTTQYDLGPGVARALAYSFAEEMAPDFERPVPPGAQKTAMNARRSLKRSNHTVPQLSSFRPDVATYGSAAARFQSAYADYYSDNYA